MLTVTVTLKSGRGSVASNRTLARTFLKILQRNTPIDTGALSDGWYIDYVDSTGFALVDDVYYGYWVNNGNTRGLKPRRFVERSIGQMRGSLRAYDVEFDAVEE